MVKYFNVLIILLFLTVSFSGCIDNGNTGQRGWTFLQAWEIINTTINEGNLKLGGESTYLDNIYIFYIDCVKSSGNGYFKEFSIKCTKDNRTVPQYIIIFNNGKVSSKEIEKHTYGGNFGTPYNIYQIIDSDQAYEIVIEQKEIKDFIKEAEKYYNFQIEGGLSGGTKVDIVWGFNFMYDKSEDPYDGELISITINAKTGEVLRIGSFY